MASHGTWEKWDISAPGMEESSVLQGHEPRCWWRRARRRGREEHQSNQLTQTPSPTASPACQGPDQGCRAEDAGALLPALSSPSHRGVSVSPWGSVSNAAEHCARLPAAVWRGATACLFPGCRPALLLNASGFLAVMVVFLSN